MHLLKAAACRLSVILVLPRIVAFHISTLLVGPDRALEHATQSLARVPGLRGQYLRRAFLPHAGVRCHPSATVCFGTVFSKAGAILERNVYVGPGCHVGLAYIEENALIGAGVHVPSGRHTHGTGDVDVPIRDQAGTPTLVRIGAGSWIGSAAVVLADVGRNSVVGAGSIVTRPVPSNVIAAGVPAKTVREREHAQPAVF